MNVSDIAKYALGSYQGLGDKTETPQADDEQKYTDMSNGDDETLSVQTLGIQNASQFSFYANTYSIEGDKYVISYRAARQAVSLSVAKTRTTRLV